MALKPIIKQKEQCLEFEQLRFWKFCLLKHLLETIDKEAPRWNLSEEQKQLLDQDAKEVIHLQKDNLDKDTRSVAFPLHLNQILRCCLLPIVERESDQNDQ
jgi:hypothetical protein